MKSYAPGEKPIAYSPGQECLKPSDFLGLDALLSEDELKVRGEVHTFLDERLKPNVAEWWEEAVFLKEIVPELPMRASIQCDLTFDDIRLPESARLPKASTKVWPAEVESMLYGHPAIQEACVIGIPDEQRGETAKAFVVVREGEEVAAGDVIEWAKGEMAAYKYPRQVEFVDALPKSGSGKSLWRELQEKEREKTVDAK